MTTPDASAIERYAQARAWLDELAAFARAARAELAPDSPLLSGHDVNEWLGQIAAYQYITCERCAAVLAADVLGPAAYAAAPFARVCGVCYADLLPHHPHWRRHARLVAYAVERPDLLAGVLIEAQRRLQLDDRHVERALGLDGAGIVRLALCPRPRPGAEDTDLARIASHIGVDIERLRADLIAEVWVPRPPVRDLRALISQRQRLLRANYALQSSAQPAASLQSHRAGRRTLCGKAPRMVDDPGTDAE